MPSDLMENMSFNPAIPAANICLSPYQYRLNMVYRIASPLLEDIYGLRTSQNTQFDLKLPEMVSTANRSLLEWYQDLPFNLSFDQINDLTPSSSTAEKMHHLQALSLQLTYDNLMIVLHRPLLAARVYQSSGTGTAPSNADMSDHIRETSFNRCLNSALRISNIQQKPKLFALARTTHLVSFLGMNLFTASVVLFICALSDTLSDTAQEAKRGLKRTLQMQKSLSSHASLSLQCSRILEDLVQLILKKEMEEMLVDHSIIDENPPNDLSTRGASQGNGMTQVDPNLNSIESQIGGPSAINDVNGSETSHGEGSHFMQSLETLQRGKLRDQGWFLTAGHANNFQYSMTLVINEIILTLRESSVVAAITISIYHRTKMAGTKEG
jgi:hypothetical protein